MWINYQFMAVCPLNLNFSHILPKNGLFLVIILVSQTFYPNWPIFLHGYIRHIRDIFQLWIYMILCVPEFFWIILSFFEDNWQLFWSTLDHKVKRAKNSTYWRNNILAQTKIRSACVCDSLNLGTICTMIRSERFCVCHPGWLLWLSWYDTVSDVVESKVHQCQQNSDA